MLSREFRKDAFKKFQIKWVAHVVTYVVLPAVNEIHIVTAPKLLNTNDNLLNSLWLTCVKKLLNFSCKHIHI